jgi:hypothetical protein
VGRGSVAFTATLSGLSGERIPVGAKISAPIQPSPEIHIIIIITITGVIFIFDTSLS